jgi:hypothetical protein
MHTDDFTRRRFLQWLSGGTLALTLPGCGGGKSSDGGGGGGGGNPSIPEAAMRSTLDAIGSFVATVPTADRAAWRTQILTFLNARSDIDSAGETPDGLWAITTDGVPLALWNNRLPDPPDEDDRAVPTRGTETPGRNKARFAVTVGAGFTLASPRLSRLLSGNGYAPTNDGGTLPTLKATQGEGVFFFNTHGGEVYIPQFAANGTLNRNAQGKVLYEASYGLWSGTKIDPRLTDIGFQHDEFVAELKAKRLALALAPVSYVTGVGGVQAPVNEWHFCITAAWVRRYLSYPPGSFPSVWLAVCRSGSAAAAPLRRAFLDVGANVVSGWTEDVNGNAVLAATSFVFDRLLGANEVQKPATPQRPFDIDNVFQELRQKGLHRHPTTDPQGNPTTTDLIYEATGGDASFGLFAPSIAYVLIDESKDQAQLIGLFGTPAPEDRKVTIDGVEAAVSEWSARKVVCALKRSGAGAAGDVQVIVQGHKSNVRRISRWNVTGTYKMTVDGTPHRIDGTLDLIFRADVGEYRNAPGNVFIRPTRYAVPTQDSQVHMEAKGIASSSCGQGKSETRTWSGEGRFPAVGLLQQFTKPYGVIITLAVNTIDRYGALGFSIALADPDAFPLKITGVPCEGDTVVLPAVPAPPGYIDPPQTFGFPTEETLPDGTRIEFPLPAVTFSLNPDGSIPGGSETNEAKATITWNAARIEFAPRPEAARGRH